MGQIRARRETGNLLIDFHFQGVRCREQTALPDNPANRKKLQKLLDQIELEIKLGRFVYDHYFPNSKLAEQFCQQQRHLLALNKAGRLPTFAEFTEIWLEEMAVTWRTSYKDTVVTLIKLRILPTFGDKLVDRITKADIMQFRASLGKVRRENGTGLTAGYINRHTKIIYMILNEAADRYHFTAPVRLKPLKVQKTDVDPFTMEEVELFINHVGPRFRDYFIVRFFTGMRTGEVDGLQWRFVDWTRGIILIRETWVRDRLEYTKNDGSQREIKMSEPVRNALLRQRELTGKAKFVFSTKKGTPHNHRNVTQRIWYPTLHALELRDRTPYQTRHTAATLWLAAGENPEWIARQMGHTTTEMLFRVYSRYVPNLTRQDGSAADALLQRIQFGGIQ
ncbi:Arm DNA-binding domain-containing protein [Rheinheimera tilapiae]|jgi:integrase|uniref:Arm DNA-binding domain-containing protein n=1 Tax=Rheinheimera tilapiae TaxID=875043 RepID=A0ABV6BCF0_9GAMM